MRLNPVSDDIRAAPALAASVVCALGMHRSGTSLIARILNLLGVYLGEPPTIANAGWDNPKGYWEHQSIAVLNEEILERFGGRWDDPPAFPAHWTSDPRLADLRERARSLLLRDFSSQPVWGWKDPRTCLTIPFWQELVGPMHYVVCLRNPCDVLASLSTRNGMGPERAERLWLLHVQSALTQTSGHPRLFVFYDDVMTDWATELGRMATFIGRPERAADPAVKAAVGEFLEKELCHHRSSLTDLAANQRISVATKNLYIELRRHDRSDRSAGGAGPLKARNRSIQRARDLWPSGLAAVGRQAMIGMLPSGTARRRAFTAAVRMFTNRPMSGAAPDPGR